MAENFEQELNEIAGTFRRMSAKITLLRLINQAKAEYNL